MRYWIYKNNSVQGSPTGYWGDWECMFFNEPGPSIWGGSEAFGSAEVHNYLDHGISAGDVVVAYQTDRKAVMGFARVVDVTGPRGRRELLLQPLHSLDEPFMIHRHKQGTCLEKDSAVNGRVAIRELGSRQMQEIVDLSGAPKAVLSGRPGPGGWVPPVPCIIVFYVYDVAPGRDLEVEGRWWEDPPTYAVREVDVDEQGNRQSVRVLATCRDLDDAIDAAADILDAAEASDRDIAAVLGLGLDGEAVVWRDDGRFEARDGDDVGGELLARGDSLAEVLRSVRGRIEFHTA